MAATNASGGHGNPQLDLMPVNGRGDVPMATHVAVRDGDWFDPATWQGGKVPGEGALVHIPKDKEVTYDGASDASLFMVRVDGTLTFMAEENPQTKMVVDTIITSPESKLEILASRATDGTVDIVFAEGTPAANSGFYSDHSDGNGVIGRYDWDPDQLSLGLVASGEVNIRGQAVENAMKLTTGPSAGDTVLEFDAWAEGATTWQPGHQIVVGAAAYTGRDSDGQFHSQDEVRTITAIEVYGEKMIVHLDEPLDYDHVGPADPATGEELTVPVGNLSRNVTFSSAVADQDGDGLADRATSLGEELPAEGHYTTERGHIMFMHNDDVSVKNSAFFGLGRTDKSQSLDDFVTREESGDIDFGHRLYEDRGEIGVYEEGIDLAIETPPEDVMNMRGRYALHLHMAGVGHDHHDHDMPEGAIMGPCAKSGDPVCMCSAVDEDGDGKTDFYLHDLDDPAAAAAGGTLVDTDGDGRMDAVRHSVEDHARLHGEDRGALIEGNVVWGSPGWGIVQHDSRADLIDNVTYDIDGAAYVSESGNEVGRWEGNAAFTTYGSKPELGNDDSDDFNDDFGHEGIAFWLHSRAIDVVDNIAVSSARTGYFYRQNGVDLKDVATSDLGELSDIRHGAEGVDAEDVPITLFDGNEVIGAREGIRIITDPLDSVRKFNDAYSHLTGFTGWEIGEAGVKTTYTSKYIFDDFLLLGSRHEQDFRHSSAFFFKVSSADITVANSHVEGFNQAVQSWFKIGNRQEYRRGYWDPLSPWKGDDVELHEGIGTKYGIDNPAYNLWNQNIVNLTWDNLNSHVPLSGRSIEIDGETYDPRRVWDASGAQGDAPKIQKTELGIRLIDDSAKGGLVGLWREDLKTAPDYEAVLREYIPLAYQDSAYLGQIHFSNGRSVKRAHREEEGHGIADDIWSGTALEFVKTDSLGDQVFVYRDFSPLNPQGTRLEASTNEKILFTREMIDGVLETEGYYSSPGAGMKFVAMRMVFTDRLTGEYTTKEFLVGLDLAWQIPDNAVNNGLYRPHEHSIIADSYALFRKGVLLENRDPVTPKLGKPIVEKPVVEDIDDDPLGLSQEDAFALLRDAQFDLGGRGENSYGRDAVTGPDKGSGVIGAAGEDRLEQPEELTGGGSAAEGAAWNRRFLTGDDENNHLSGDRRAEIAYGHGGDDFLQGRHGNDHLFGGSGDDLLHGGRGEDLLVGGSGADRFRFDTISDDDVIRDFESDLDVIEILHTGLSLADVSLVQDGEDVLIEYGEQTIRVEKTAIEDLDGSILVA